MRLGLAVLSAASLLAAALAGCGNRGGSGAGPAGSPRPEVSQDPDAKMREILAQIEAQKKKILDAKNPPPAPGIEYADKKHDMKAELVLKALKAKGVGTIRGRVYDPVSKAIVPACVAATDAGDRIVGSEVPGRGFWTNGEFQVKVLPGHVRVSARAGRFVPATEDAVEVRAGQTKSLPIAVARPAFLRGAGGGWYAADLRARATGGKPDVFDGTCDLDALCRVAMGQGISILGACGPYEGNAAPSPADVQATCRRLSTDGFLVLPCLPVGSHPVYGWAFALGLTDWRGLPPPAVSLDSIPVDLFEEVRARGGLVFRSNLAGNSTVDVREELLPLVRPLEAFYGDAKTARVGMASALPLETVMGPTYDGIELDGSEEAEDLWFCLLNLGYRLPALATSNACLQKGELPEIRALVRIEGEVTAEKAIEAVAAGRLCVTFGPALLASVPDRELFPGDSTAADGGSCNLQIEAYSSAEKGVQLDRIEVIRNGKVVHTFQAEDGMTEIREMSFPIRERAGAWYVVRALERSGKSLDRRASLSNPIWFDAPGASRPAPPAMRLTGTLLDDETGRPLAGRIVVLAAGEPTRTVDVENGRFELKCPASAALIAEAEGFRPKIERVCLLPPIVERIRKYHVDPPRRPLVPLASPAAYEGMRLLLIEQRAEIRLRRAEDLEPEPGPEPEQEPGPEEGKE